MTQDRESGRNDALDVLCRDAVRAHRTDAFDNIDVATLMNKQRLSIEDARWIGRHLMENGRALAAYRAGQAILGLLSTHRSYDALFRPSY